MLSKGNEAIVSSIAIRSMFATYACFIWKFKPRLWYLVTATIFFPLNISLKIVGYGILTFLSYILGAFFLHMLFLITSFFD
jgi:hypothetical protein